MEKYSVVDLERILRKILFGVVDVQFLCMNIGSIRIVFSGRRTDLNLKFFPSDGYWRPVLSTTSTELRQVLPNTWGKSLGYFPSLTRGLPKN